MSIPPVPNHPPRPGRRKPAEESPESITTQLFIGEDESAAADGSTQALTPAELQRLRSMVESDGTDATEVLSLEELRGLAAAEGYETGGLPAAPRKVNSDDIAAAEAASAPKQWNPLPGSQSAPAEADQAQPQPQQPDPHPHQGQWGGEFGAGGQAAAPQSAGPVQSPARPDYAQSGTGHPGGPGYGQSGHAPAYAAAPAGYAAGYGPGGPAGPGGSGGPGGPGGPGRPGGPHDPYGRRADTKKVPAWLWVLAAIALILALGIVGYIVWDATQGEDTKTVGPTDEPSIGQTDDPGASDSGSSKAPVAEETFTSPSGNIACTIDSERARCVIKDYDYSPPQKPDDCKLDDWGSIVVANKEGAGFSCVEAPEGNGPARVLGYGDSISAAG
ncbi:hypothetical protein SAMN04489752_2063 [Brevibacterium siliguriense]|uniref:Uncharacterized protein n=1 Tax=Brevibacterium siliguriense TaxID=1136497 RepID=A0A1H1TI37_9MICO|nr:hypothetical protein [Brevibacterium siliguriense]SDS59937.1 hypothetical protein SAMN04489752_2063 [Brevibacterium siliguriense]